MVILDVCIYINATVKDSRQLTVCVSVFSTEAKVRTGTISTGTILGRNLHPQRHDRFRRSGIQFGFLRGIHERCVVLKAGTKFDWPCVLVPSEL